ncbi:replication protein (plasmid) [Cutibacterium acnes]|uniref:Replication protein n=1 Tax=Cutibacterium acnes TaxID=1747 RepID=A0AA44ZDL2_CUTAC|nr:replication protein [Cutibacterium acnes]PGF38493.1 replication protein [Cutibacterium acnes subsp. defendens]PHJ26182.1 replication protein [Cutibacterium acnes]
MRVSRRALMAVARADAAAADHATGRWVATANATVARLTGLCERTVQYARATLVHLGLCRVVATGRYLTADERRTAARTHGGRQMRAASTRVLTMSCAIVCALPRRGHHYRKVKFLDGHQRTRRRVRRPATPEKKPLWLQKLAALLDAMNRRNRRLGLDVPCADDQHNPLGLFIHQARDTLTHDNPHERRLAREHHRAQLIDDQLRRRAETATCAARLAAEHADPDYQTRRRERRETLRATLRAAQQHVRTH